MMGALLDLGPHSGFILACYAVTAATVAGLFVWVMADRANITARLAALEAQGVTRRSRLVPAARPAEGPATERATEDRGS